MIIWLLYVGWSLNNISVSLTREPGSLLKCLWSAFLWPECANRITHTLTHTHSQTHIQKVTKNSTVILSEAEARLGVSRSDRTCAHWVMLLFCLCPADGGSEHVQAQRFVSGSGETALLRAQSAARRKHYLYPLSRSSLHRNSQYQPSPWEWVRRKHAHNTHTRLPARTHLHPFTCTHAFTDAHTLLHGTWTAVFLLYGCDPLRLARCSCLCLLCFFLV